MVALTMCVAGVMLDGGRTVAAQLVPLTDPAPYVQAELPQCALHLYRHLSKTGGALPRSGVLRPHARMALPAEASSSLCGRVLWLTWVDEVLHTTCPRNLQAPRCGSSSRSRR